MAQPYHTLRVERGGFLRWLSLFVDYSTIFFEDHGVTMYLSENEYLIIQSASGVLCVNLNPPQSINKREKMKWLSPFLAVILFDSTRAEVRIVPDQKHNVIMMRHALSVRGGDLGQVKSKTLAKILSGLCACDAVGGSLAPISCMKLFGVNIAKGSLSEHFLHGIGASAATTAVSTYLAISGTSSIEKAIGYGLAARLVSMTIMIITNRYHELGMNNAMFGTMWAVLAITTYSLFSGNGEPLALTQLVSLLLGFHGAFLFLKPEKFMKRAILKGDGGKSYCESELFNNALSNMLPHSP